MSCSQFVRGLEERSKPQSAVSDGSRNNSTEAKTKKQKHNMMKAPSPSNISSRRSSPSEPESFISTLHRMLTEIDQFEEEYQHLREIVCWQDHGMAFKIHNRQRFIDVVMPIWFSRLKYSSFTRQLNSYGFKRVSKDGNDKGAIYHESFIRDMPEMAAGMQKPKPSRASKRRSFSSVTTTSSALVRDPDFQQMALAHSLSTPAMATDATASTDDASNVPLFAYPKTQSSPPLSGLRDMLLPAGGMPSPSLMASAAADQYLEVPRLPPYDTTAGSSSLSSSSGPLTFDQLWRTIDDNTTASIGGGSAHATATSTTANMPNTADHQEEQLRLESTLGAWEDIEPLRVFPPGTSAAAAATTAAAATIGGQQHQQQPFEEDNEDTVVEDRKKSPRYD